MFLDLEFQDFQNFMGGHVNRICIPCPTFTHKTLLKREILIFLLSVCYVFLFFYSSVLPKLLMSS